jgi:hypothetical protein
MFFSVLHNRIWKKMFFSKSHFAFDDCDANPSQRATLPPDDSQPFPLLRAELIGGEWGDELIIGSSEWEKLITPR